MKVSFKEKVGYSLGDVSANLVFQVMLIFQLKFYTDVFGLEGAIAGLILLFGGVASVLVDPTVGILCDRTQTKWGKFRPWLLWSALPLAVFYVLAFYNPGIENKTLVALYATVSFLLLSCAYSFCNTPFSSLSAVMSGDMKERTSINNIRMAASAIAIILVQGLTLPLVHKFGSENASRGWLCTVALYSVVVVVFLVVAFFSAKERINHPPLQSPNVKKDIQTTVKTAAWRVMFVVTLCLFVSLASWGSAMNYYFQNNVDQHSLYRFIDDIGLAGYSPLNDFLNIFSLAARDEGDAYSIGFSLFNISGALVQLLGILLFSQFLSRRYGKRKVLIVCFSFTALFTALFYFPSNQDVESVYILNILKSLSYAPTIPLLWAMIGDVADYVEYVSGRRATGFCFACILFALKLGIGFGCAFTGIFLSCFGYSGDSLVQSEMAVQGIRIASSIVPALLLVACVVALKFYPITKDFNVEMQLDLADRRGLI